MTNDKLTLKSLIKFNGGFYWHHYTNGNRIKKKKRRKRQQINILTGKI